MGFLATYLGVRFAASHHEQRARHRRNRARARERVREADARTLHAFRQLEMPTTKVARSIIRQLEETTPTATEQATYYLPAERLKKGDLVHSIEGVTVDATVENVHEVAPGVYRVSLDRQPRRVAVSDDAPCRVWI